MPICILLVPEAASKEAKHGLMSRLSGHIHEAYPVTTTHIFVREASGSDMMLAGSLVSQLPAEDNQARGARVCFLVCPPGVKADAKKAMMEKLTADISDCYPGSDDIFIIHREDSLGEGDAKRSFPVGEPEVQPDSGRITTRIPGRQEGRKRAFLDQVPHTPLMYDGDYR